MTSPATTVQLCRREDGTVSSERPEPGPSRLVLIEDSPSDAAMVRAALAQSRDAFFELTWARCLSEGLALIDETAPDCVLLDLGLSDSDGLETLDSVIDHGPELAVVVLTGFDDGNRGATAVARGAQDYLVKGKTESELLVRTVRHAIRRKSTELATRRREARFRSLLDLAPDAIVACDPDQVVTFWNRGATNTYGWSAEEAIGRRLGDLISGPSPGTGPNLGLVLEAGEWLGDALHLTKDGRSIAIEGRWTVLKDDHGETIGFLGANRDVTRRRAIEEELEESRAKLANLIDIAPDAIVSIDEANRITLFNQGAEATFGFTSAEAIGQPLDLLMPDDVAARDRNNVVAFTNEERSSRRMGDRGEVMGRRKDGAVFPAEVSISKLERGGHFTFTAIMRDVSARRAAEEALRDSEARLDAVLDTLPIGVVVTRAEGDPVYVNQQARAMLGPEYGRRGTSWRDQSGRCRRAGSVEPCPQEQLPLARALRGEAGMTTDLEMDLDGTWTPLRTSFAPIRDRAGRVELGIAVFEDITDERRVARELSRQTAELARSNAELEQFAYVASHDMSEPLRTIAGFVQLLAQRYEGRIDSDADEFINFALEGVRRMQALIKDLLTYSRVARSDYELELVDCNEVVSDVANALGAVGLVHASHLPTVLADTSQLRRLFQNLIGNGLKFVPEGREPQVAVSAARREQLWEISVTDNGLGVSPEHLERIFKMFQRLYSQDEFPGSGLGLSICERIVDRHGGRIWAESCEGVGSTFHFTLPDPGAAS